MTTTTGMKENNLSKAQKKEMKAQRKEMQYPPVT